MSIDPRQRRQVSDEEIIAFLGPAPKRGHFVPPPNLTLPRGPMTQEMFEALLPLTDLGYVRRCMEMFPGRRGVIHLARIVEAINKMQFQDPRQFIAARRL